MEYNVRVEMEMEDRSKLPHLKKPSKLRPPQVKLPLKIQPLTENTTSNVPGPSKIKQRRSNSAVDIKLSASESANLHKLVDSVPVSKAQKTVLKSTVAPLPRKILTRRSKSVADLRAFSSKPAITITTGKMKPLHKGLNVAQSAPKRKADKTEEVVKPKVMKQPKLPDWDYKGRFNQLQERHNHLVAEHKQCMKREEVETLKQDYTDVKTKFDNLTYRNSITVSENVELKSNVEQLTNTVSELTHTNNSLENQVEDLQTKYEEKSRELRTLQEENRVLNDTKTLYERLVKEHAQMKLELEELNKKFKSKTSENVSLTTRLENCEQTVDLLKQDVFELQLTRRVLHNTIQDMKGNIRVFCRVRPALADETHRLQCMMHFPDEKTLEIRKSKESVSAISGKFAETRSDFVFDRIFEPRSSQEEVFEDLSQLIQSALDGYDVCVFAYGQTGSGKTFTMQGGDDEQSAGMIPRAVELIFDSIKHLTRAGWRYEVSASFLEIYNENVRDLLNPNPSQNLEIRFNEGKGTTVTNLRIEPIACAAELQRLMLTAQQNRAVAATDFNEHSSRSHAVTKIYLKGWNEGTEVSYSGSVNLVDLAGSESAKTSAQERLVETKNINKSLAALGNVMLALYNKDKHVPYRNSKLTYLLQSCLGGNSKTLMIVNIAPFEECHSESISSLRFAAKVKEVKTCAKRNKTLAVVGQSASM